MAGMTTPSEKSPLLYTIAEAAAEKIAHIPCAGAISSKLSSQRIILENKAGKSVTAAQKTRRCAF
ncbi:hypothetical protein EGJ48_00330 [Pantoea dispersa]|nr:hypothetical protein EGJ48_00330 [Pantoea dispersa]